MNYYLDQEFIEGFKKPWFGKRRHFIDLISIGIVAEDGRELYLISKEYNYNDADDWVKQNVIHPLYIETVHGDARNIYHVHDFHKFFGKSNKGIVKELQEFILGEIDETKCHCGERDTCYYCNMQLEIRGDDNIIFYADYASYDWVLLCSLFGRMINLPDGFPMFCKDLEQYKDDIADKLVSQGVGTHSVGNKWYPNDKEGALLWIEQHPDYPVQNNVHNALEDARFNKRLHEFIKTLFR